MQRLLLILNLNNNKKPEPLTNLAAMQFILSSTLSARKALLVSAFLVLLSACKKTETLDTMTLDELFPLTVGKYITYRVDSLVFVDAGKTAATHRYQFRHIVEKQVTDNLNRPAWQVVTYINDSLGKGAWVASGVYIVTPTGKQLEVNENNQRVIKLQLPAKEGFTWKGNSYLSDRPYNPAYEISVDGNMSLWEYTYKTINQKERIGSVDIDNVTTITHIDAFENVPMKTDTAFASRELSFEKYAKNIGLVYKELELWENQPKPTVTNGQTYYNPVRRGFGVKMWMIGRN